MDKDTIDDLKQFIVATVGQQLGQQTEELRKEIRALDVKLSGKIDTLSDSVAEALDTSNEEADRQLKNHEIRITKLEAKAV